MTASPDASEPKTAGVGDGTVVFEGEFVGVGSGVGESVGLGVGVLVGILVGALVITGAVDPP